jgi:AcrR family transcriptional regulator
MKDPVRVAMQEQLAAARREQILDAAVRVFAQKGFHLTTIKDIGKDASLSEGTIYNYFENKTALLIGILERMRIVAQVAAQEDKRFDIGKDGNVQDFMRAFFSQPLQFFQAENIDLYKIIFSEITVNEELRERFHQQILEPMLGTAQIILQRWADLGVISPRNLDLTARAIASMILGLLLQRSMDDQVLTTRWEELPDVLSWLVVHGMSKEQP